MEVPSASFRLRDEGGVERHLAEAPRFGFNKMVRGRSTPVVFGGHFHVTRFGMFRSRAGLALNPWSTAASPRTAYRHRPYLHTQGVILRLDAETHLATFSRKERRKIRGLAPICRRPEMAG